MTEISLIVTLNNQFTLSYLLSSFILMVDENRLFHFDNLVTWMMKMSLSLLVFYVTCDDILVIYATAFSAGGLKKLKLYLRSGSQRHKPRGDPGV